MISACCSTLYRTTKFRTGPNSNHLQTKKLTGLKWPSFFTEWLTDSLYGLKRSFQQYFNYMAAESAPIHSFLKFFLPLLRTIFFPSHCLLSHITIVETTDSGERGMNPVAMTIINHQSSENICLAGYRTSNFLLSSPQLYRLSYRARLTEWKTSLEKEKMVTSIFFFSYNVFKRLLDLSA